MEASPPAPHPPTPPTYTTHALALPPPANRPGPRPMELDATRPCHQPLTPQARTQRMQNNLCLYCGAAVHIANNCPIRPPRAGQIAATLSENLHAQTEQ